MKQRWLLAVIVSVAFHLALAVAFRAVMRAVVPAAPAMSLQGLSPSLEARPVEIIRIGVQHRAPPAEPSRTSKPAPASRTAGTPKEKSNETQPGPGADTGEIGVERLEPGESSEPARGESPPAADQPAAATPSFAELIHERLARGAPGCYPAAARRFRQRGEVTMAFCVSVMGQPEQISVAATSGSSLLDDAAKECVVPAAAPLPREVGGQCFRVPVRFGQ